MNNKKFTIIELIVAISILGILASIIIPNVSDFTNKSKEVAMNANVRNIQTAVDSYFVKNYSVYPTESNPTLLSPVAIDFNKLKVKYLRDIPKQGYFWVDYSGKVWSSTVDSPIGLMNNSGVIEFNVPNGDVSSFNIYGTDLNSGASNEKMNSVKKVMNNNAVGGKMRIDLTVEPKLYSNYLISSIDSNGLESAPVGIGYEGINPIENTEKETLKAIDLTKYSKIVYVSQSGSDLNSGNSINDSLKTISKAKNVLGITENGLILLDAGDYEILSLMEMYSSKSNITYMPIDRGNFGKVYIRIKNVYSNGLEIITMNKNVTFNGIIFTPQSNDLRTVYYFADRSKINLNFNNCVFTSNELTNAKFTDNILFNHNSGGQTSNLINADINNSVVDFRAACTPAGCILYGPKSITNTVFTNNTDEEVNRKFSSFSEFNHEYNFGMIELDENYFIKNKSDWNSSGKDGTGVGLYSGEYSWVKK